MQGVKGFDPVVSESSRWKHWRANITPTTCMQCVEMHGKIFDKYDILLIEPPLHPNCRCEIIAMLRILAGTATIDKQKGADYTVFTHGKLPDNYVTKEYAKDMGWRQKKGNLQEALPSKVIGGNIYKNIKGKLPEKPGRTWYEADINYIDGYRNKHRLLYSNDGLVFVSYDHCETFYEINWGV